MKRTIAFCLALVMLLGIVAGCKKTETVETKPQATEAPAPATEAPAAPAPTEVPAPTEPPFKGAYPGDDYSTGAVGEFGAAACANPVASQIGVDILKAGGNAVDAAVAMIYAVGLLEPAASGMGGAGQMVIYLKAEDRYLVLEYMTQAPGAAIAGEISTDTSSNPPSVESLAIPGVVHGTMTALEKYGSGNLTRRQVLQPVIDLARNGFTLPQRWNTNIEGRYENLSAYPYTLGLYTDDGFTYSNGQTIYNKDLADTLDLIADGGKEAFYNSDFTQKMVDYIQSIGGILTREDFAQYETKEREAISTTYRGNTVYTVGGPSNGGVALLEMLNIMENFDMKALGRDSMEAVKVTADAYALAEMDGVAYMADPDYYDLPVQEMISKEYAKERAAKITLDTYLKNARDDQQGVRQGAGGQDHPGHLPEERQEGESDRDPQRHRGGHGRRHHPRSGRHHPPGRHGQGRERGLHHQHQRHQLRFRRGRAGHGLRVQRPFGEPDQQRLRQGEPTHALHPGSLHHLPLHRGR